MNKALIFDLLEYPLAPVGDGDLVVLDSDRSLRRVVLRNTPNHVLDVARDQTAAPWLITRSEIYLLVAAERRELAFETERFGTILSGGDFYPSLVGNVTGTSNHSLLALNTMAGSWLLSPRTDNVVLLNSEPLAVLLCSCWAEDNDVAFGGMSSREEHRADPGVYVAGRPLVVSVDATGSEIPLVRMRYVDERVAFDAVAAASTAFTDRERRVLMQLSAEVCLAGSHGLRRRLLIGMTGLHDPFDSVDVSARYPTTSDMHALIVIDEESGKFEKMLPNKCAIASLRNGVEHFVYVGRNDGAGPTIGSLERLSLDAGTERQAVSVSGIDLALRCSSFRPSFHSRIGYFGTIRASTGSSQATAYFIQSDDALRWRVIADERGVTAVEPT